MRWLAPSSVLIACPCHCPHSLGFWPADLSIMALPGAKISCCPCVFVHFPHVGFAHCFAVGSLLCCVALVLCVHVNFIIYAFNWTLCFRKTVFKVLYFFFLLISLNRKRMDWISHITVGFSIANFFSYLCTDWKALLLSFNGLHVRKIRRCKQNIFTTSTTLEFLGENIVHIRSIGLQVKFLLFIFITSSELILDHDSLNNQNGWQNLLKHTRKMIQGN